MLESGWTWLPGASMAADQVLAGAAHAKIPWVDRSPDGDRAEQCPAVACSSDRRAAPPPPGLAAHHGPHAVRRDCCCSRPTIRIGSFDGVEGRGHPACRRRSSRKIMPWITHGPTYARLLEPRHHGDDGMTVDVRPHPASRASAGKRRSSPIATSTRRKRSADMTCDPYLPQPLDRPHGAEYGDPGAGWACRRGPRLSQKPAGDASPPRRATRRRGGRQGSSPVLHGRRSIWTPKQRRARDPQPAERADEGVVQSRIYSAALCHAINQWQVAEWLAGDRTQGSKASIVVPYEYADAAISRDPAFGPGACRFRAGACFLSPHRRAARQPPLLADLRRRRPRPRTSPSPCTPSAMADQPITSTGWPSILHRGDDRPRAKQPGRAEQSMVRGGHLRAHPGAEA